jgi:hypothetical protein
MKAKSADSAGGAKAREVRLDRLVGRTVVAGNNQPVGPLEECRVEKRGRDLVITEYVIGVSGLIERLGVAATLLAGWQRRGGYIARWDQLDISEPDHPRLTCSVDKLRRL